VVTQEAAAVLLAGHDAASTLRNAVVLVTGRATTVVPIEGRDAESVRRIAGAELFDTSAERAVAVRAAAEEIIVAY
jgi:hypothetical protein